MREAQALAAPRWPSSRNLGWAGIVLVMGSLSWVSLDDGLSTLAMAQGTIRPLSVLVAIMMIVRAPRMVGGSPQMWPRAASVSFTLYVGFSLFVAMTAIDPLVAVRNGLDLLLLAVLLWILVAFPRDTELVLRGVLSALLAIQAAAIVVGIIDPGAWRSIDSLIPFQPQLAYPGINPNGMGSLALIAVVMIAFPKSPWTPKNPHLSRAGLALSFLMFVLSQSRTAYTAALGITVIYLVEVVSRLRRDQLYRVAVAVFVAMTALLTYTLLVQLYTRGVPIGELFSAKSGRGEWWESAGRVETHLIGGGGLGSSRQLPELLAGIRRSEIGSLHNSWLEAKLALGHIPAIVLLSSGIAFAVTSMTRAARRSIGLLGLALSIQVFARAATSSNLAQYSTELLIVMLVLSHISRRRYRKPPVFQTRNFGRERAP